MRQIFLIFFSIAVCLFAGGQELPVDPELRLGVLPNGLTYYIRANQTPAGRADFWMVHKVGSVMEEEDERGLAHFLEHMAFTGTKNYSDRELFGYLTQNGLAFGTDVNATTSYDDTQYYICNVPTRRQSMLDSVLYIMRDLSCNLLLDENQIDKERAIIQEERTSTSNFQLRLQEHVLPVLMQGSRYAHRIPIGLPKVVDRVDKRQLQQFYHQWYRPDRQALVVVGDFDAQLMERKVKRIFGVIPVPIEPSPTVDLTLPDHKGLRIATYTDADADATMVNLYFKHDNLPQNQRNTHRYLELNMTKQLALYMLGQRLDKSTRQAQSPLQMAQAGDTHFITTRSKEALAMTAIAKPGQVLATVEQLLTEARRMALHGFSADELAQARAGIAANMRQYALQVEHHETSDYVSEYIDHYLSGSYIPGVAQEVELSLAVIERLTLDEVNALVRQWVSTDNACLLIAGREDENYPTEAQLQASFKSILTGAVDDIQVTSVAGRSLMHSLPQPGAVVSQEQDNALNTTTLLLSNSARVVLRRSRLKAGEVLFDAIARGGQWVIDTALTPQLKVLEPAIEDSRLGGYTQDELRVMLADKQLAISFGLDDDHHDLIGGCATADLETLMQAIHLYFTDVTPDEEAYQALVARLRALIQQRKDSPEAQLADSIAVAHYGKHPLALPLTEAQLDNINYDQLLQLYRQYVARPDQFTFIFVGDFDVDTITALAARYIASLRPTSTPKGEFTGMQPMHLLPGVREVIVRASSDERAQVQVTLSGLLEQTLASEVMMQVYGHVVEIALNSVLREEHQLTYGASATASLLRTEPRWTLQYQYACRPQDVERSTAIAADAITLIKQRGVSQQLFDKVKQMMLRRHEEDIATNAYWMNVLRHRALDHDIHTGLSDILQSITIDQFDAFLTQLHNDTSITVTSK